MGFPSFQDFLIPDKCIKDEKILNLVHVAVNEQEMVNSVQYMVSVWCVWVSKQEDLSGYLCVGNGSL